MLRNEDVTSGDGTEDVLYEKRFIVVGGELVGITVRAPGRRMFRSKTVLIVFAFA